MNTQGRRLGCRSLYTQLLSKFLPILIEYNATAESMMNTRVHLWNQCIPENNAPGFDGYK